MKPLSTKPHWLIAALVIGGACEPDNNVEPGAPHVTNFGVQDMTGASVSLDPDAGGTAVTPRVVFVAMLDRVVDPTTLQTLTDGGPQGIAGVITVTTGAGATPIETDIVYVPNGDKVVDPYLSFQGPRSVGPQIDGQPMPALPSNASVSAVLHPASIRAKDGSTLAIVDPGVSTTLTFQTAPFGVSITVPVADDGAVSVPEATSPDGGVVDGGSDGGGAPVAIMPGPVGTADPKYVVKATFTNVLATDIVSHVHVSAWDADAHPLPDPMVAIAVDSADPTTVDVQPAMGAMWPTGSFISVTIDADAADAFGVKLGQPATAAFTVAAM